MNLKGLKNKSALKFLIRRIKNRNTEISNSTLRIQKVGILAEVELFKTYDFTKKISEDFKIHKKDFDIFLYDNDYGEGSLDMYQSFSEKDFGMRGKMKSEQIRKFAQYEYDLLIDYCGIENVYSKIICLESKSKLKAGFKNDDYDLYDIAIDLEGNRIDTFNEELTKYLTILKLIEE